MKFLFLLYLGMIFSSAHGLQLFSNCIGCIAESITDINDPEYKMYEYYREKNITTEIQYKTPEIIDNYDIDELEQLCNIQDSDDIMINLNKIYPRYEDFRRIQPTLEVVKPKPIRMYFLDSEDVDDGSDSEDDIYDIPHYNSPVDTPHVKVAPYGCPFSVWSDYDEDDIQNILDIRESGTTGKFYANNIEIDRNIDDHFLGGELSDIFPEIFIQNSRLEAAGALKEVERIVDERRLTGFHKEFFGVIHHILQGPYFLDAKQTDGYTLKMTLSNENTFYGYFIEFSITK